MKVNSQGVAYTYVIRDSRTGAIVGYASTLKRASRRADKLDLRYGAIRYRVERLAWSIKVESGSKESVA